jgi:putative DNA primase/helicase
MMMKKTFDLWDKETKSSITVEATKRGKEWMAHCPKHDDQHESLAINEEKEVYLCHGCHWKGSFYKPSKRKQSLATKKVIATYGYQDEAGNLLFQVLRYEPKEFRVRRLDGKGGWIWNIEGLDSVPYLLPDLLKGNGPIFIVEGEKDADNLRSLGLVATTNPFGAGKWKPSYNRYLKGRELIIVPDNDHPGNAHAENTAKSLLGIAKSIKIVRLPNLPDGGDVTDYVNAGGSKEHLQKLIEETMLFDPGIETYDDGALCHESTEISNGIETLHDLLSKEITPRDSIIGDGLIARKDFDIFSGPQKKGKSLLSLNLAIRVAQGQPWLGFEIESPRRVGIVQQEVSEES